jgi:hypothetical protein
LRQIGGEGITNYPIGVGINSNNEILVADNHNNFNLTVFSQEGKLINALESKVKHAQCFDVGLMDDGSIVLASKDYRIYVYKYSSNVDSGLMLSSPTSSLNNANSSSSNMGAIQYPSSLSSVFPSVLSSTANKYELFSSENNNNNSNNSNGNGFYSYFKSGSTNDNILNNGLSNGNMLASGFGGFFSELNSASGSTNAENLIANHRLSSAGLFGSNSNDTNNFLVESSNANDLSHNESTSLLNLSTNTTTTNNINSMLNGIINNC